MNSRQAFLVLGGTGRTGRHFVRLALEEGHRVRVLARMPEKLSIEHTELDVVRGSLDAETDVDALLDRTTAVVAMIGDAAAQRKQAVNLDFIRRLVPAMRRQNVRRLLYQAGGLSAPPDTRLPTAMRIARHTLARSFAGQHRDNEAVMRYLNLEAPDIEWIVHRAAIGSDHHSKGVLVRSAGALSIGTFVDCAAYNLRTVVDRAAVHTCDTSIYQRRATSRAGRS